MCDVTASQSPAPQTLSWLFGITPHFLASLPLSIYRARPSINVSFPLIYTDAWFGVVVRLGSLSHHRVPGTMVILTIMLMTATVALASVAQLVGHHPAKQKVAGLIPGRGTGLGFGFSYWSGSIERRPVDVSLPLSVPSFPLSKTNKLPVSLT